MPEECFERTGLIAKTTMLIDGEVVSGFAANFARVESLIQGRKVND